jgi:hypothetical protein
MTTAKVTNRQSGDVKHTSPQAGKLAGDAAGSKQAATATAAQPNQQVLQLARRHSLVNATKAASTCTS